MNSAGKYEYVMEPSEIREFCRTVLLEQFKFQKRIWLRVLLIIILEALLIPEAAVLTGVFMIMILVVSGFYNYTAIAKILRGQPSAVWIEGDRLKAQRREYSEMPCRNIRFIRRTKHLLMLGYMQGPKRPAWFVVPLRVFENEQEVESFLGKIRNPQPEVYAGFADAAGQMTDERTQQEYMRFSYLLDGERWVRFQKGAADLLNGGSLGKSVRTYSMIIWCCVMTALLSVFTCFVAETFSWLLFAYSLFLAIWTCLWLYCRDPEKRIRKQLKTPETAARACGSWQVVLAGEGITVSMPTDMKNCYPWASLEWLVETEELFYLFHKDKRHFIMIAKECFVSWDQVDVFHRICADKGIKKVTPKKARYVPGWLTWVILGMILLAGTGVFMIKIFQDSVHEAGGGYVRVPLDKQVEVLTSLGLHVPEETVESVRSSMVEYELYDLVEESPYTWLLTDMGAPDYDEDWNLVGYSDEVFWFDFEGFDLTTDYIDVLNGMLALAQESPLDGVGDIKENTENVDWERGRGTVTVSLRWKGQEYRYDMSVYNDWIDEEVLGIFNSLLEQETSQKRFYVTGDNGQGAIVFFCTEEWAEEFSQKTGLILE